MLARLDMSDPLFVKCYAFCRAVLFFLAPQLTQTPFCIGFGAFAPIGHFFGKNWAPYRNWRCLVRLHSPDGICWIRFPDNATRFTWFFVFFGASNPFCIDFFAILGNSGFFHIRAIGRLPGASRDSLISFECVHWGHKKVLGGIVEAKLTRGGHFGGKISPFCPI